MDECVGLGTDLFVDEEESVVGGEGLVLMAAVDGERSSEDQGPDEKTYLSGHGIWWYAGRV